jgi:hypothetical protein
MQELFDPRSGLGELIGPDGEIISRHRQEREALQKISGLPAGDYEYRPASVRIRWDGHAAAVQTPETWAPTHIDYGNGPEFARSPGGVFYGTAAPQPPIGSRWRVAMQPDGHNVVPMPGGGFEHDISAPGDYSMTFEIERPDGTTTAHTHTILARTNA